MNKCKVSGKTFSRGTEINSFLVTQLWALFFLPARAHISVWAPSTAFFIKHKYIARIGSPHVIGETSFSFVVTFLLIHCIHFLTETNLSQLSNTLSWIYQYTKWLPYSMFGNINWQIANISRPLLGD